MKYSYDYSDLLEEIKDDLLEGLISPSDKLKIVRRKEKAYLNYYPVIDYAYDDSDIDESFELMTVSDVLKELEYQNSIF